MKQRLIVVFTSLLLSVPATYLAAVVYLVAIDPSSGMTSAFSEAVFAPTGPLAYTPPAGAVGVVASLLERTGIPRRAILAGVAAALAGAYVGWRETFYTPAIPTLPAIFAAGAVWAVTGIVAILITARGSVEAHTQGPGV